MSEHIDPTQADPQTRPAQEPETTELEEIDPTDPEAVAHETAADPPPHGSGPTGPQQENAETSLDQPSDDTE